jgi:anti-anti-sigma regulatory factor
MYLKDIQGITIYEVQTLKVLFLDAIEESKEIILDMQGLGKIDIVGIQLLISFVKTTKSKNIELKLQNIPENIYKQIELSHCENALGLA